MSRPPWKRVGFGTGFAGLSQSLPISRAKCGQDGDGKAIGHVRLLCYLIEK
ncbi:hypothetical protein MED193_09215 [Roseobacter sp. MED193]|nr:hypothetical protein MED193_09215 [Roseobacter sp. MED193]